MRKTPQLKHCPQCRTPLLQRAGITACVNCDLMANWPGPVKGRWKPALQQT